MVQKKLLIIVMLFVVTGYVQAKREYKEAHPTDRKVLLELSNHVNLGVLRPAFIWTKDQEGRAHVAVKGTTWSGYDLTA